MRVYNGAMSKYVNLLDRPVMIPHQDGGSIFLSPWSLRNQVAPGANVFSVEGNFYARFLHPMGPLHPVPSQDLPFRPKDPAPPAAAVGESVATGNTFSSPTLDMPALDLGTPAVHKEGARGEDEAAVTTVRRPVRRERR